MASGTVVACCCVWLQLLLGVLSIGMKMESQFEHCCSLGTNWAFEGFKCETFTGPVAGVATVEQGLCLSAVEICCVKSYHEQQCKLGKSEARSGLACVGNQAPSGDYHRDCCEGCKLGILTGSMGQGCAFKKFAFGKPWDPAFLECCHESLPSTTETFVGADSNSVSLDPASKPTVFPSSETPKTTSSETWPTPELDDICILMKGKLCSDICIPSPGSYKCACREGFTLLEDEKTCVQNSPVVDRCKKNNPCEQRCTDTGGAILCSCNPGYVLASDKHSCQLRQVKSKPETGGDDSLYKCPEGYQYKAATQVCDDIDECAEGTHTCFGEDQCFNQPGGFTCARAPTPISSSEKKCPPGTKYTILGCKDIDECTEIEDACSSNEECENTPGSYTCRCKMGFSRDNITHACIDVNECQIQTHSCLDTQRCDNTPGSYTCVRFLNCGTGYTLNAVSEVCEDDDECALGTHGCAPGYVCRNTPGSHRCDKMSRYSFTTVSTRTNRFYPIPSITTLRPPVLIRPPSTTGRTTEIVCPPGFLANGNECVDEDECNRVQNPCTLFQRCVNTMGSYRCMPLVRCGNGYKLDGSEQRCIDVDECADSLHDCGPKQTCENRLGGYLCSCPAGHTVGPNRDCVDINECTRFGSQVCGSNSRCENTVGSYKCVCDPGFENVDEKSCQDVDECKSSPGICQHKCINVWGSYRCACSPGYRLNIDGRSCTDVDECMEFKQNNLCVGICQNTPGSYSCQCPNGYRLGNDQRTCQDIDECSASDPCRDPAEICQNTRGSYRCNRIDCPPGYHRDTARMNRCLRTSRYCRTGDMECFRMPSHYSFNFITFVSMLPIPQSGQLDLFTMRASGQSDSTVQFRMELIDVRAPPGVQRATESCFALRRPAMSQALIVLTQSIQGPQEIELRLSMEIYNVDLFAGSAVVKLFLFVTEYEF